ncbi:MAG: M48 family metalloprotease [Planctomycetota bacterium]|nr:M48 family metalloprotease [Planctomycetota bacterium]
MSPLPLVLVAAVLAADAGFGLATAWLPEQPILVALVAIGPTIVLVTLCWWRCVVVSRLVRAGRFDLLPGASLLIRMAQALILFNAILVILVMDWLAIIRGQVSNLILLDEVITMAPALAGLFLMSLAWYPLERTLAQRHGATLRGPLGFAWSQFSIQVLLGLVPALIILAAFEVADEIQAEGLTGVVMPLLLLLAVVFVFVGTPWLVRIVLSVRPMDPGPLRDRLQQVCQVHHVRIREIFLWRTGGLMLNAAVVGFVAPLRYVLLTDMLVRMLPEQQAEAVMAHEVGHVRCRHMPWLFLVILSLVLLVEAALLPFQELSKQWGLLHLGILLVVVWIGLGWVSRRFERQADTFAAIHLSGKTGTSGSTVTLEAVTMMIGALQSIACLNGDSARRPSWRHGSIAWRCDNLGKLVGCPPDGVPIDRVVVWIKVATIMVGGVALAILLTMSPMEIA